MKRAFNTLLFVALVVGLPLAGGLFRVWVHQDVVLLGYQLSEGERMQMAHREAIRQLEVELAAARAPDNLLRLAKKLGLKPPEAEALLLLKGGR